MLLPVLRKWCQMQFSAGYRTMSQQQRRRSYNHGAQIMKQLQWNARRSIRTTTQKLGAAATSSLLTEREVEEFLAEYPDLLREIREHSAIIKSDEVTDFYVKSFDYNVKITNKQAGLTAVLTYKNLVKGDDLTPEKLKLAHLLAWCTDILWAALFISDDMTDDGVLRRGKPCWHKLEEVGANAVNGMLMIISGCFEILRNNFQHLDCYAELVDVFNEYKFKLVSGQAMDVALAVNHVSTHSMAEFNRLGPNKLGEYLFQLPVFSAMHLAGQKDKKVFDATNEILVIMGTWVQAQNDYLDAFDELDLDKFGTDIENNKCSLLSCMCMDAASPEQKAIMLECYGQKDYKKVRRVKQLYHELDLPAKYAKYEEDVCNKLKQLIHSSPDGVPREALLEIMDKTLKRLIK